MDFLQQASSLKEMHHGTRAVCSLFTALPLLSDFFSSHCTQRIPGSTVTGCLSWCIYTQFPEKLTSHILATDWNCTQCKIFTMPSFASNYFTASYCSSHFLWGLCLWQMLVLCQDLKFPVSQSLLWVSLCLKYSGLDFQRGWNEEQKQCLFSPCES